MPPIRCFLIEPVLVYDAGGAAHKCTDWEPGATILKWVRKDTGEEFIQNSAAPVGAMWRAIWYPKNITWQNETEPHLLVRCPNGDGTRDWDIDARCSNCGFPEDRLHRCWVRHGVPPLVHVDKAGITCTAGAGSIALPQWHGFLTNGVLQEQR